MKLIARVLLGVLLFAATPALAQWRPYEPFDPSKAQSLAFEPGAVVVTADDGTSVTHAFQFEVADNHSERSTGLMHRSELGADSGMLFDFGRDRMVSMWMRNTFIPLDMLFISKDGTVQTIAVNTTPHSERSISSRVRVRAVLELPAGTVERLGIKPGDRIEHAMFAE
jgi:uncharacterized membrane protein (UPF0127 family)